MISNIDTFEVVVSNNFTFDKQDFKYFIGFKDNKKIRALCIFFPEMIRYRKYSDQTKYMYFMIEDENFFDKYMTIWEKVTNIKKQI